MIIWSGARSVDWYFGRAVEFWLKICIEFRLFWLGLAKTGYWRLDSMLCRCDTSEYMVCDGYFHVFFACRVLTSRKTLVCMWFDRGFTSSAVYVAELAFRWSTRACCTYSLACPGGFGAVFCSPACALTLLYSLVLTPFFPFFAFWLFERTELFFVVSLLFRMLLTFVRLAGIFSVKMLIFAQQRLSTAVAIPAISALLGRLWMKLVKCCVIKKRFLTNRIETKRIQREPHSCEFISKRKRVVLGLITSPFNAC